MLKSPVRGLGVVGVISAGTTSLHAVSACLQVREAVAALSPGVTWVSPCLIVVVVSVKENREAGNANFSGYLECRYH